MWTGVLCLMVIMIGFTEAVDSGICAEQYPRAEMLACKFDFITMLNASTDGQNECSDIYQDVSNCFQEKVIAHCYLEDTGNEHNTTIASLWEEFGDEDLFCEYGLLKSLEQSLENRTCLDGEQSNYTTCESPYRDAFRQFLRGSSDQLNMKTIFANAQLCQLSEAALCSLVWFDDVNPYDEEARQRITETTKIIVTDGGRPVSNTMYVTVAVVGIVLIAIICVVFFLLWRRDQSRTEIRRRKSDKKKSESDAAGNSCKGSEMQPLAGQAVVTTADEVSTA